MESFSYRDFEAILNQHVFGRSLEELLGRMIKNPERFVGLFRPSTPSEKILQNLIQAREIKFGDAMEEIISQILQSAGYKPIQSPSQELRYDQLCFSPDSKHIILVEQKVRDDHDSTKRRGQFENFKQKVNEIVKKYPNNYLHAIMYFLDPEFKKNYKYYLKEMDQLNQANYSHACFCLFYGSELFSYLNHISPLGVKWDDFVSWVERWKSSIASTTRELDVSPENAERIARKQPKLFLDLVERDRLWEEGIIKAVFPEREPLDKACDVLSDLFDVSRNKNKVNRLKEKVNKYYSGGVL